MQTYRLGAGRAGQSVADQLHDQGVDLELPCAGTRSCGRCRVHVVGDVTPVEPGEASFLTDKERAEGVRLACVVRAIGSVEVRVGAEPNPLILTATTPNVGRVLDPLMAPGDYGIAVDIGTTTVVAALYRGDSARQLGCLSDLNRQRRFGADVISRIHYAIHHGVRREQTAIRAQVEGMIHRLCLDHDVPRSALTHAVVTGNTTMLHLFTGLDPRGIGRAPFTAASLFGQEHAGLLHGIRTYLPPCVSAYAGADLVCAVLASELVDRGENALLADIGTNGEIALLLDGVLWSCSTAAGPAFEGAGISHGMPARAGAMNAVWFDRSRAAPGWSTIGGAPAVGVCGSGLVDAVAMLVEHGAVRANGRLLETGHPLAPFVEPAGRRGLAFPGVAVSVSQDDIRAVQLAKGAIRAGMQTLLDHAGGRVEDLDTVYLCGGFGSFLDLRSAELVGLVPPGIRDKTVVLDNGALSGAAMTLLDGSGVARMEQIVRSCHYVELSGDRGFLRHYVEGMRFTV